jgi:hypothetical protein
MGAAKHNLASGFVPLLIAAAPQGTRFFFGLVCWRGLVGRVEGWYERAALVRLSSSEHRHACHQLAAALDQRVMSMVDQLRSLEMSPPLSASVRREEASFDHGSKAGTSNQLDQSQEEPGAGDGAAAPTVEPVTVAQATQTLQSDLPTPRLSSAAVPLPLAFSQNGQETLPRPPADEGSSPPAGSGPPATILPAQASPTPPTPTPNGLLSSMTQTLKAMQRSTSPTRPLPRGVEQRTLALLLPDTLAAGIGLQVLEQALDAGLRTLCSKDVLLPREVHS